MRVSFPAGSRRFHALAPTASGRFAGQGKPRTSRFAGWARPARAGVAVGRALGKANDPDPLPWYYSNLAWAYYVGQRYDEALKAVSRYKADFPALYAAVCVRLGRLEEARGAVADARQTGTKLSIATEGFYPEIEPIRTAYLNDLRAAGVPEK